MHVYLCGGVQNCNRFEFAHEHQDRLRDSILDEESACRLEGRTPLCYNGELLLLGAYPSETHMGNPSQEALGNAERIIQEWIDTAKGLGRPIPEPKGRLLFA